MICGSVGTFFLYPVIFRVFGYIPGALVMISIIIINYYKNLILLYVGEYGKK